MAVQSEIGDGVVLNLPEGLKAVDASGGRRGPGARGPGEGGDAPSDDVVTKALQGGGFDLAADVELMADGPPSRSLSAVPASVDLTVSEGESAVILVQEPSGVLRWSHPAEAITLPARRGLGGGGVLLRFDLAPPVSGEAAGAGAATRRALPNLGGLLNGVRLRVLRYIAAKGIDVAVGRLEGGTPSGLVIMADDPAGWVPTPEKPQWPVGRPARVLLMVHGTFSTTIGSFVGLTKTGQGRRFLELAKAEYDVILGFDHPTLAQTVEQNAEAMMKALVAAGLPDDANIDAVAYSRGGLVYRVFAEEIIPRDRPQVSLGRAVFVGCTNGGTNLASPANWAAMADVYVNIMVAGAAALSTVTGPVVSAALAAAIRTLGQLVKVIPEVGVNDGRVPGLASMKPDGPTVKRLNGAVEQEVATPLYHAITSSFKATLDTQGKLSKELIEFLADRLTDRLFGVDNDLVVHVSSMTEFGGRSGRFSADRAFSYGEGDAMYHIRYFDVDQTPGKLMEWLELSEGAPAAAPPPSRRTIPPEPDAGPASRSWSVPESEALDLPAAEAAPDFGDMDIVGEALPETPHAEPRFRGGWTRSAPPTAAPVPRVASAPPTSAPPAAAEPTAAPVPRMTSAPPTSAPPPTDTRHFAAETQPTPRLGGPCAVFVTMSGDTIRVARDGGSATTDVAVPVDTAQGIWVMLIARSNCEVVGQDKGEDKKVFPAGMVAATLRFEIEGRDPGVANLLVEIRQGDALLTSLDLAPVFVSRVDTLRVEQVVTAPPPGANVPMMLRIYEIHQADNSLRLRFDLSGSNPNVSILDQVDLGAGLDVSSFVTTFLADLENAWNISEARYDEFIERLSDTSIAAANLLLPLSIRKALWKYRDSIEAVQIISEQPSIPWELLYISDPDGQDDTRKGFLSEWGAIRWMYNARWPGPTLDLKGETARMVVPEYADKDLKLTGAAAERDMLGEVFPGISEVTAKSLEVTRFLGAEAAECGLIHFACHGEAEQRAVLQSDLLMSGGTGPDGRLFRDPLTVNQVKVRTRMAAEAPSGVVFINACQTGRTGEGIAGVSGFADSFIRPASGRGAAVFVGALWSVSDKLALDFARTFYESLNKGETLIKSVAAAREACKAKGDFTWLAYTVYGNPMARISTAP